MRKVFKPMQLFISMLFIGSSSCFVACSDSDDNTPQLPDEATTETMFGNYTGKMMTYSIIPLEDEGTGEDEEVPAGTEISANVNNDTVYFEKFPIKDIVLSIIKDEALADKIVEAVGDINYKVGYEPTFTMAKDSIKFVLNPKPLKLAIAIPSLAEGEEAQELLIEVKVEPGKVAGYAVESANMKFNFAATEVLLGQGEEQTPLPGFTPITFNFDMDQDKAKN